MQGHGFLMRKQTDMIQNDLNESDRKTKIIWIYLFHFFVFMNWSWALNLLQNTVFIIYNSKVGKKSNKLFFSAGQAWVLFNLI